MNRIIYDARHIAAEFTGLARYSATLLTTLLATADRPGVQIDILLPPEHELVDNGLYNVIRQSASAAQRSFHHVPVRPITFGHHLLLPLALRNRFRDGSYFYPHFDPPLGIRLPITFVVHDLIPLKVDSYIQKYEALKRLYFATMVRAATRRSQRCIAVSQTTRSDLQSILPVSQHRKIEVVYEGPLLGNDGSAQLDESPVEGPYLLYVGDRRPHKNLPRMIELFQRLRNNHGYNGRLVLAGNPRNFNVDIDRLLSPSERFVVTGPVRDTVLRRLYQHADALLLLSAYEGFGLPVVEAVRCGTRVMVSNGGSLAEIAPPNALVLPLHASHDEWATSAARWLASPLVLDAQAYLHRFDWTDSAKHIFPTAYIDRSGLTPA